MQVSRDGNIQTIAAKIGARKSPVGTLLPAMPRIEVPPMGEMPRVFSYYRGSLLGIEGQGVHGQLAEFFGTKEGVLVTSVIKDSAAEKAGIKAGDVIVKVDDQSVHASGDITRALRSARDKKTVTVIVVRSKKEMPITVTLETPATVGNPVRALFEPGAVRV